MPAATCRAHAFRNRWCRVPYPRSLVFLADGIRLPPRRLKLLTAVRAALREGPGRYDDETTLTGFSFAGCRYDLHPHLQSVHAFVAGAFVLDTSRRYALNPTPYWMAAMSYPARKIVSISVHE